MQLVVWYLLSILIKYIEMALLFFVTKTDTGDKMKYYRLHNNTEIKQENNKDNTSSRQLK